MRYTLAILLSTLLGGAFPAEAAKVLYAGLNGGLYKSTDSGTSWQLVIRQITGSNSLLEVFAIAIDPGNSSRVYLAGNGGANFGSGPAVHTSSDGGQTWSTANMPQLTQFLPGVVTLSVDPLQTSNIYVGCPTGFYRSTDSGRTWTRSAITTYVSGLGTDANKPGVVYATSQAGFFKSTDYGVTFTSVAVKVDQFSSGFGGGYVGNILTNPRDGAMYAPAGTTCVSPGFKTSNCGVFKSTDGGTTWTNLNQEGWYKNVTVDLRSGALYAGGAIGGLTGHVIKSVDGGNTWTPLNSGITSSGIEVFIDPDDSNRLYGLTAQGNPFSANAFGIYLSTTGGASWKLQSVATETSGGIKQDLIVNALAVVAAGPPPASNSLNNVSAASGQSGPVAAESIVTAKGSHLATGTASADLDPPVTILGGTTVTITDASGATVQAPLFSVSPTQVNYQIPPGTALGTATVTITAADGSVTAGQLQITDVAPGVFTLNGAGLVKAYALRISGSNQFVEDVYQVDATGAVIARPVTISNGDQVYLLAYGTGFRAAGTSGVTVTIGGISLPVLYAGPIGTEPGVDQFNIRIPPELANSGQQVAQIALTAGGQAANTVNLTVK